MSELNRFSEGLIDAAERVADVVDAAQGKGARQSVSPGKWLLLPAAGAAAYALATSSSGVARRTRSLMQRAKDRATELPEADLMGRVKEVTGSGASTTQRTRRRSTSRSQGSRSRSGQARSRRKTTSAT